MEVSLHLARSSTPKLDQNEDDIMNSIKELGQVVHPAGKAYLVTSLGELVFSTERAACSTLQERT